ncbi:unnamed protein product [Spirodela intermedia]|uniref:Uncharacterized protein n=1 Tax=Spirodela intermedia TaxID=51605 RepID=A0A7I8IFF7_SPIIN|nr:unnamed protein product [Spirodela intermedia]CAA6656527.1 unnamed protein product [Spirodela intermedia]
MRLAAQAPTKPGEGDSLIRGHRTTGRTARRRDNGDGVAGEKESGGDGVDGKEVEWRRRGG